MPAGSTTTRAKSSTGTHKKGQDKRPARKAKPKDEGEDIKSQLWECRMHKSREWGHQLYQKGGTHQASVKNLLSTLQDGRSLSQQSLRRTALHALTPAASVGHRGALSAQANALMDRNKLVRECALDSLWEAAGGKRPEKGGAVHAMLSEVIPPKDARFNVESRRAAADALARLVPKGDPRLHSTAMTWLNDEDAEVRCYATHAAGFTGSGPEDVMAVSQRLKDGNWRVNRAAVDALQDLSAADDGVRRRCKPPPPPPPDEESSASEAGFSVSELSANSGDKTNFKRQTSTGSRQSLSGSMRRSSTRAGGAKGRRASVKGSASSLSAALSRTAEEDDDPGDPDGMPRPTETHLAATAALAQAISHEANQDGSIIRGLARRDAVAALRRIAPWGDCGALEAVGSRLHDADAVVRREAVRAMGNLAQGEPRLALNASVGGLTEQDWRARASAVESLLTCSDHAVDSDAFEATAACLEHGDWGTRRGAILALRSLTTHGLNEKLAMALEAINSRLNNDHWSVRRHAVKAVGSLCETAKGDITGVKMLKDLAEDPDEEVRIALASVLPRVAPKKCKEAVLVALRMASDDEDLEVRLHALAAVEQLCSTERSRTREAVNAVVSLLGDANEEVRLAAKRVICSIAQGRRTAIAALTEILKSGDENVRNLAVETFPGVAESNREHATKRTMRLIRHPDEGVRNASSRAIAAFSKSASPEGSTFGEQVLAAAASVASRWRQNRFSAVRGNMLGAEERLRIMEENGEDIEADREWDRLFGPTSAEFAAQAKRKNSKSRRKKVRKSSKSKSDATSGALTSRQASEFGEEEAAPESDPESSIAERRDGDSEEDSDGGQSEASKKSGATESSKITDGQSMSRASSAIGIPLKGKAAEEFKRMKAEAEKEEKRLALEQKKRIKAMQDAMASSEEEEWSQSGTDDELWFGDGRDHPPRSPTDSRGSGSQRRRSSVVIKEP
eukprot:TRINITY_DN24666_c0_g1_i1.p1 TRINITY_DN24666_c0_g1~~TRINITY_DN24666_c0_g1_i1.p1  ORF type:complete len:966 (+),score=185.31 TRINITY_DN24666_c0_g1_i1:31-2928(+)